MQHRCKHCDQVVAVGSPTTAIVSGTLGDASLDDFNNFYVFHDTCFVEVGGEEYSPADAPEVKEEKSEYVGSPEVQYMPLWKDDQWR